MFGADERSWTFTPLQALASHASVAAVTPHPQNFGTLRGIRTHTLQFLKLLTLPVGLPGHILLYWICQKFDLIFENFQCISSSFTSKLVCWPPTKIIRINWTFLEWLVHLDQIFCVHKFWYRRGESNSWQHPYERCVLPLNYSGIRIFILSFHCPKICLLIQIPSTVPAAPPRFALRLKLVGRVRLELTTPCLKGMYSDQLSYRP